MGEAEMATIAKKVTKVARKVTKVARKVAKGGIAENSLAPDATPKP